MSNLYWRNYHPYTRKWDKTCYVFVIFSLRSTLHFVGRVPGFAPLARVVHIWADGHVHMQPNPRE